MEVVFEDAALLCYRIFDVANEVDLERARGLLEERPRRLRLTREGSQYLLLPNPPIGVELGRRMLATRQGEREVDCLARVFDHGAVSIQLRLSVTPGTTLSALVPLADELYDSAAVEALCLELVNGLRKTLAPAFQEPHLWEQNESYTVIFATALQGAPTAPELLAKAELARLLLGESAALSQREREDVLQHAFSYTDRDLAVIDWNAAFVYEPSGSFDIPDVLEICNAQLLELRYYDDLLDLNLRRTYDALEHRRSGWTVLGGAYKPLARRVLLTLLDLSELLERVENSLKIIGDFYLAKVYEAALLRLRVRAWQLTVTGKQRTLQNVYQLLKDEVDVARSLSLELLVVILIVAEVVLAIATLKR